MNIFNKDGFIWWIGVVEDRMDPEKAGRVRVRIYGYHTDNKLLLPTTDLPWAIPITPITSASISGIGNTPLGPLEGTWVIGFFIDGADMQHPAIFGTISTKVAPQVFSRLDSPESLVNRNDGFLRDSNNNIVLDGNGEPIRAGTPPVEISVDGKIENWTLGKTSEQFETGGRGPGTINNYQNSGDFGGASYGSYQFASYLPNKMPSGKSRPNSSNSPLLQYLSYSKFGFNFKGLTPATDSFDNKWKEVASTNTNAFKQDQHDYVEKNYYLIMLTNLKRNNLDLTNFGPGVQDLIWSTAVQLGPNFIKPFTSTLANKSVLTGKEIVELVSQYKIYNVDEIFKSSSLEIKKSIRNRYIQEKSILLQYETLA